MRIRALLQALVLIGVLRFPGAMFAQFQEPTADELKMTADPLAPGASAVYLYREETTDDAQHSISYYCRIKILTEKGKEQATVEAPYVRGYDTIKDIQGRTIHADGKVVALTAKPSDLMERKSGEYQRDVVVFTLPDVEVGSILEYRLKINYPVNRASEPVWDVQIPYFIHTEHFGFQTHIVMGVLDMSTGQIVDRMAVSARLPQGSKVEHDGMKESYSLDLTNVPAAAQEDWMPPLNTLRYRVEFYFTNAQSPSDFWADAEKQWAKRMEETLKTTSGLKKAAEDIVGPGDTELQKAQKIYEAVQKLDNTRFSREKSQAERKKEKLKEIKTLDDVWKQKSGTDDEIALLYVALARGAGLKAWPAKVVERNRALLDMQYYSMRQLDDFVAKLTIDGKDIYVDPGQRMCPFGTLSWRHSLAGGFELTDGGAVQVLTPASGLKETLLRRVADLTIEPTGELNGSARFVMSGQDALRWRQDSLENDQDEMKKQFNEAMREDFPDGVRAELDHFTGLDDYNTNLIAFVKVESASATMTGKHFILPGLFFESQAKHPFVAEDKREMPVDVRFARIEQDDVVYHLPDGTTIESAPEKSDTLWAGHAELKIATKAMVNSVEVVRTLVYNYTLLGAKDYPDLHDFYQKVAAVDQQQIVLNRAAAGAVKGN